MLYGRARVKRKGEKREETLRSVSIVSRNIRSTGQRSLLGLLVLGICVKGSRGKEDKGYFCSSVDQLQHIVEKYDIPTTVQLLVKGGAQLPLLKLGIGVEDDVED